MLRSEEISPKLDPVFAPEARRTLAGDEITGTCRARNRVLKGRQTRITRPALLPEREILALAVPAVPPQANIRRASSAGDASSHTSKLPLRNIS
jgi:hypothetical protein